MLTYLLLYGRNLVGGMPVGTVQLIIIDHTGGEEVEQHLRPQRIILRKHVFECGTHGTHAYKTTHAEGRRNQCANGFPRAWDGLLGPTESGHEEKRHGSEHNEQDNVLAIADKTAYRHAKEDGGEEERDDKRHVIVELEQLGEVENAWHTEQNVAR